MFTKAQRKFKLSIAVLLLIFTPAICSAYSVYEYIEYHTGDTLAVIGFSGEDPWNLGSVDFFAYTQEARTRYLSQFSSGDDPFHAAPYNLCPDGQGGIGQCDGNIVIDYWFDNDGVALGFDIIEYQGEFYDEFHTGNDILGGSWRLMTTDGQPVPEPATMLLLGSGLLGLAGIRRRMR